MTMWRKRKWFMNRFLLSVESFKSFKPSPSPEREIERFERDSSERDEAKERVEEGKSFITETERV